MSTGTCAAYGCSADTSEGQRLCAACWAALVAADPRLTPVAGRTRALVVAKSAEAARLRASVPELRAMAKGAALVVKVVGDHLDSVSGKTPQPIRDFRIDALEELVRELEAPPGLDVTDPTPALPGVAGPPHAPATAEQTPEA